MLKWSNTAVHENTVLPVGCTVAGCLCTDLQVAALWWCQPPARSNPDGSCSCPPCPSWPTRRPASTFSCASSRSSYSSGMLRGQRSRRRLAGEVSVQNCFPWCIWGCCRGCSRDLVWLSESGRQIAAAWIGDASLSKADTVAVSWTYSVGWSSECKCQKIGK